MKFDLKPMRLISRLCFYTTQLCNWRNCQEIFFQVIHDGSFTVYHKQSNKLVTGLVLNQWLPICPTIKACENELCLNVDWSEATTLFSRECSGYGYVLISNLVSTKLHILKVISLVFSKTFKMLHESLRIIIEMWHINTDWSERDVSEFNTRDTNPIVE